VLNAVDFDESFSFFFSAGALDVARMGALIGGPFEGAVL